MCTNLWIKKKTPKHIREGATNLAVNPHVKKVNLPQLVGDYIDSESQVREEWCPQFLPETGGCGPVRVYTVM